MPKPPPSRCERCGGYVDRLGQTVQPIPLEAEIARVRLGRPRRPSEDAPATEDPYARLTPGERYQLAVERRDVGRADRRASGLGGRRAGDTNPTDLGQGKER